MVQKVITWLKSELQPKAGENTHMKILRKGPAMRVIFFYPGEEGTYVDHAEVTLYENGIVQIASSQEETTTHLQNCEILWRFETEAEERANKLRLLKPKSEVRPGDDSAPRSDSSSSQESSRNQNPDHLE